MKPKSSKKNSQIEPQALAAQPDAVTTSTPAASEEPPAIQPQATERKTMSNSDLTTTPIKVSARGRDFAAFIADLRTKKNRGDGARYPANTSYALGVERGLKTVAAELLNVSEDEADAALNAWVAEREARIAKAKARKEAKEKEAQAGTAS